MTMDLDEVLEMEMAMVTMVATKETMEVTVTAAMEIVVATTKETMIMGMAQIMV